jgi:acyl-CoA synthetase (AMP-forming)/AMP-acid ligase II
MRFGRLNILSLYRAGRLVSLSEWLCYPCECYRETVFNIKLEKIRADGTVTHAQYDPAVFSKVAARLGGRVRLMITGSAPIATNVLEFLRIAFSCHVVEGYGQTESIAGSTLTCPGDDQSSGHVGIPVLCNGVKLVDVPEMGYTGDDVVDGVPCPRGEVCFKGSNIFQGLYSSPSNFAKAQSVYFSTLSNASHRWMVAFGRHWPMDSPTNTEAHRPQEKHFQDFFGRIHCTRKGR